MIDLIHDLEGYQAEYQRSVQDPEGFWAGVAEGFHWQKPWDRVLDWNFEEPSVRWFEGGLTNLCYNAVDRHALRDGDRVALIWEPNSPNDAPRQWTYRELQEAVARTAGTAKGEANSLTIMFKRSNMMEWVVKCPHCGRHNVPYDYETCMKMVTINPDGPGCIHCGKWLDMKLGTWIAAKPQERDHIGMHIPQFCIPARGVPKKWRELMRKVKDYSNVKLSNEVFGLPVGAGGRPLSLREAMACCNPARTSFDKAFPKDNRGILVTVLGVDWSVTGSSKSYTMVSILGYDYQGKCYLLYTQKLDGIDILEQVKRVEQLYHQFDCSMIGSDRGVGVLQGQLMKQDLGEDKVNMINYVAAKLQLRWDRDGAYFAADRTMNMDTMLLKAKMGPSKLETPCWDLMSPFWQDALNLFEEETMAGRRVFRKDEDQTDDWFHSMVFGNIAYMIVKGDFKYIEQEAVQDSTFNF